MTNRSRIAVVLGCIALAGCESSGSSGGALASGGHGGATESGSGASGTGGAGSGTGGGGSAGGSAGPGSPLGSGGHGATGGTSGGAGVGGIMRGAAGHGEAGGGGGGGDGGAGARGGAAGAGPDTLCPNCRAAFDGVTLDGWTQVPANSWSVTNGAMHSLAPARGYIYTDRLYGSFRFIFVSRLISDPAAHVPCVLFWGNRVGTDALGALQVQPPLGYMWDYRPTGATANQDPARYETHLAHPTLNDKQWSQCEMLADVAAGTMRMACCQLSGTGEGTCKATEVVDFKQPGAGVAAPLALQVHNAAMIEEFKGLYVESPVADPTVLLTTR